MYFGPNAALPVESLSGRVAGRVRRRQHIVDPFAFPLGHRGPAFALGYESRTLDELVLVDVARAVRKDFARPYPDDELCLGILRHQGVARLNRCLAVQSHPPL